MSYSELDLFILKTLITNKKNALEFVSEQDSKLFSPEVWNFANIVIGYVKTFKEVPTLRVITEKLEKGNNAKLLENVKDIWSNLENLQYNDVEYKHDLQKLKQRFAEKQISGIKDTLSKLEPGTMDVSKALNDMQKVVQNIKALDQAKAYESKNIKDYLPTFVEKFNARKNNPGIDCGIMTGYSAFDFATNGVRAADFILITGESGFGKSLFLNNIAIQTWMQKNTINDVCNFTGGKNIAYFSLEMPYEDCFNRLISRMSGVPSRKIENADLTREEFSKIKKCLDFIDKYPYVFKIIDIADISADELERIFIECEENFDVIFVDYLGIMKSNKETEEQDWLKQGIIAYEVRAIARRHKLPIFSAVQLNRKTQGKGSSENIGLNRLARSGTIATHATHVIQIENREGEEKHIDFIYHFIKNRKGPKIKGVLIKNLACATLIDRPDENADEPKYDEYFHDQDDISEALEDLEL